MLRDRRDVYASGPVLMLLVAASLIIPIWQLFANAGFFGCWSLRS